MSGGWCVIFNYDLAFVIQVAFEYVGLVTNVDFTRRCIEGKSFRVNLSCVLRLSRRVVECLRLGCAITLFCQLSVYLAISPATGRGAEAITNGGINYYSVFVIIPSAGRSAVPDLPDPGSASLNDTRLCLPVPDRHRFLPDESGDEVFSSATTAR